ncbi:calcium-binding protein [Hyphomicrobium sp. ghe19]|uniref:calcium-binding protein n=1 Tax=Hyphomicrobium sp. ghe19 TaxID=2682968 RepID=UPI0013670C33|nr:Leukotoxin [Hyphomicrobium sp. ghe19]
MTFISGATNSTALSILQNMNAAKGTASNPTANAAISILGPLETTSKASKQAAEKVVAILNEQGGTIDLSRYGSAKASVTAGDHATITTGDGIASIYAQNFATIYTGNNNDEISTYANATVHAGGGNDVVQAYSHATVDAGDGDDWVYVYDHSVVDGGAGNDVIRTYDYSTVDGGDGDDFVVTLGNSAINGGAGNDTLVVSSRRSADDSTFDNAVVDGGEGDDYIQVNGNSTVTGGTGNDTIRLIGDGNTVIFNKGDGHDTIGVGRGYANAKDSATINIKGYSADDVTVNRDADKVTVSFKGSDDAITVQVKYNASAKLAFEDGSTIDVTPAKFATLKSMDASADALFGDIKPILA